jgi:hypothetical protein
MDTDGILRDRRFAAEGRVVSADRRWRDRQREFAGPADEAALLNGETPAPNLPWEEPVPEPTFLELGDLSEPDRARLAGWVREIGGPGEGGADFARRAGAWLQARHSYSMQSRTPRGEGDILVTWIGGTEPGHCELFAGSLVLLARAAGIPARVVTGFKGGVWNETSGHISVKNSDAHAWAEIWEASLSSWLRSDPTPGSQLTPATSADQQAPGGALSLQRDSGWRARLDGLRVFWYRQVVNFDQDSQIDLLRGAKDTFREAMEQARVALERKLRAFAEWLREPWDFSRVAGIALVTGLGAGLVAWWRAVGSTWWLGWRSRRAASHRRDPVRREAARWLVRLTKVEPSREEWVPGTAAARAELSTARDQLLRLRYGARETWPAPASVFRAARRAQRVARKAPR